MAPRLDLRYKTAQSGDYAYVRTFLYVARGKMAQSGDYAYVRASSFLQPLRDGSVLQQLFGAMF